MAVCSGCGADPPLAARFCASCGRAVSARSGDERKVITVLFPDLVGSTATGSDLDPEDLGAAIRPQLARMQEALAALLVRSRRMSGPAVRKLQKRLAAAGFDPAASTVSSACRRIGRCAPSRRPTA